MANIALPVSCPTCSAAPGERCSVFKRNGAPKPATENHKPRLARNLENLLQMAEHEFQSRLDTPDTETADEFSEYDELEQPCGDCGMEPCSQHAEATEAITWIEFPARDLKPGMVVRAKDGSVKGTVAGVRVGAKWVTALDDALNTLVYLPTESGAVEVWI